MKTRATRWGGKIRRAYFLVRIIQSMATQKTDEQRLWCAVLCRAAKDTCTQNHDHEFWYGDRGRDIAGHVGLDIERVRVWAVSAGIEL